MEREWLREKEVANKSHVKLFNDRKGWGFITGNDGRNYFVHQRYVLSGGWKALREGSRWSSSWQRRAAGSERDYRKAPSSCQEKRQPR
ncbi:MAG TPA: cold shock domain-containing protein [Thermodesulfobacteriota bacterium]|nr:cold shock domain-containing protein [Thermodesulfobacteriota bacterium]